MQRPKTQEEVQKYELEVQRGLIGILRTKGINVAIGGISEKDYFSPERLSKFTKKSIWDEVSSKDKERALLEAQKGDMPVKMELPPLLFPQSAAMSSGVPYLQVNVTSWLNQEVPSSLLHHMSSLVSEE